MTAPVSPRADLSALEGYHSPQLDVTVRLNTNESPFAPPPEFVERWLTEVRNAPLNRYPDRAARALRDALGKQIGQPAERLFCANGSNEVLQTLLLTYGGPGRRVVTFEPTYALHSHIARITGTEVVSGERTDDFTIDVGAARALIAEVQPTIVFACSPNNPTGTVESLDTIAALLEATEGFVVVDEAYGEFAPSSSLEQVDDDGRLIVVRTYSKVWSLAAVRLGYAAAPTWVVDELEKVVLPYHLSVPTQEAGRVALDWSDEMAARVEELVRERERMLAVMRATSGITVFDSGANFILFRVPAGGRALWERLVQRSVLVRDGSRWPRLSECLRVTVGTPDENDAFLDALEASIVEVES
ncbi:MAG TPA: histidinol-phosphate transaminase [Acidimicrobiia bacterium]|nr:histidinol-phosphate transaminase [Acidimicrobiia bacterium]